ncbi:MAG: transposase [Paludibacter sp.]|nr:transposase [Paludibacter sp.]
MYFITICCQDRACMFGHVKQGEMILNDAGKMVESEWLKLQQRFANIQLHEYIIMPNHFHAILEIVGATLVVAPNDSIAPNESFVSNNSTVPNDSINPNNPGALNESFVPNNSTVPNDFNNLNNLNDEINTRNEINMGNIFKTGNEINMGNEINTRNEINTGQPQGIAPTGGNDVVFAIPPFANNVGGKTIGDMVGAFQSIVTVEYIRGVKTQGWQPFNGKLWQRNYWEHIVRDEQSYQRISDYIINNPSNWSEDKLYST